MNLCTVRDAVVEILQYGLIAIRNHARANPRYASVEADHLHNLPSLLKAPSVDALRYYFEAERPEYLAAVEPLGEEVGYVARSFYAGPWRVIEEQLKNTTNKALENKAPNPLDSQR